MSDIVSLAVLLLLPVGFLLFLTRRKLKVIVYPHLLLSAVVRGGLAGSISRFFRMWHDTVFDASIAIILAFALSAAGFGTGFSGHDVSQPGGGKAVVVDLSLSMLTGSFGHRPLDRAIFRLFNDDAYKGRRVFGLAFDPQAMKTRLFPLERYLLGGEESTSAVRIVSGFVFFSIDYRVLGDLKAKGFSSVTLITDRFPARHPGLDLVEVGREDTDNLPIGRSWPSHARHDRSAGNWILDIVDSGPSPALSISVFFEGSFRSVDPALVKIQSVPGGSRITFRESGLFLVKANNEDGSTDTFPVLFPVAEHTVSARGDISQAIATCFPLLRESNNPELILSDKSAKKNRNVKVISTASTDSECPFILDPATTSGHLVASSYRKGSDFALGPASLSSKHLVLAYDSAIQATWQATMLTVVPPDATVLLPAGTSWLARTPGGYIPLIPEARESFPELPMETLILRSSEYGKPVCGCILFLLVSGKLIASFLLTRPKQSQS